MISWQLITSGLDSKEWISESYLEEDILDDL